MLECEGEHNTFQKPIGPSQFDVIRHTTGEWFCPFAAHQVR